MWRCSWFLLVVLLAAPPGRAFGKEDVFRDLDVTVSAEGLPEKGAVLRDGELVAILHYALDRGPDREPEFDQARLTNSERDGKGRFVFEIWDLRFDDDRQRGYVWGEVRAGNIPVRRIPLRAFGVDELTDRDAFVLSLPTTEVGSAALAQSQPFLMGNSGFFSDDEVYFGLGMLGALISNGYVTTEGDWDLMLRLFLDETDFFRSAAAADTGRILTYLQRQYEPQNGPLADNAIFARHYLTFLNQLISTEIWGAMPPDGTSGGSYMRSYLEARIRAVAVKESAATIGQLLDTQALLLDLQQFRMCLRVSEETMHSLRLEMEAILEEPEANPTAASSRDRMFEDVNLFIETSTECAQRLYINSGVSDAAVLTDYSGGLEFLNDDRDGGEYLRSLTKIATMLRDKGQLWQSHGPGAMRGTYGYVERLRAAEGGN